MPHQAVQGGAPAAELALRFNSPATAVVFLKVPLGVRRTVVIVAVGLMSPQRRLALGRPSPRRSYGRRLGFGGIVGVVGVVGSLGCSAMELSASSSWSW